MSKRYSPILLATCVLPWTPEFDLAEAEFRASIRAARTVLTPSLYLFGTAGEGYAVSDRQFSQVVRIFAEEMAGQVHAMIGVISLSLCTIVARIELAISLGFSEFQISLPSWGTLTDAEVDRFFLETCGRFPESRFLHYNLRRAGRLLCGSDYARLSKAHHNLVAVKQGGEDLAAFEDILVRAPTLQCFPTEFAYAGLRDRHESGLIASVSALNPPFAQEYFAARGENLRRMAAELRLVHRSLKATVGDEAHMDGAYDKIYAKALRPGFPLRLLPPYESVSDATFSRLRSALPAGWRPSPLAR